MLAAILAADLDIAQNVFFAMISIVAIVSAIRVVTTDNVVHAAFWLVLVLASVGASFLLLGAEFTGVTQFMVYIGAIVVLFLFGTMLTRSPIGKDPNVNNPTWYLGLLVAVPLMALLGYVLVDAFDDTQLPSETVQTTAQVSDAIFSQYLVPFEAIGILLTAALIGAIVLARKE